MFHRIWRDLKTGKNILNYLTIVFSVVVFILTVLSVDVAPSIISACILAILSLLAVHLLQDRWVREQFVAELFPEQTWDKIEPTMSERLKLATKVKFLAIGPLSIIRRYESILKRILDKKDSEIKFIIVAPDSNTMAVVRKGRPENYDHSVRFLEGIRDSFSDYAGNLKVRLVDYVPSHVVTIIDDHRIDGVIFTTVYSFNQVDPYRPSEIITYGKEKQFSFFLQEFNSLWDMGNDFIFTKED